MQTGACAASYRFFSTSVSCSKDGILEQGHDGSTDEARNGDCDKPGHEDIAEQAPVHSLLGAQPAHGNHRSHLQQGTKQKT